MLKAAKDSKDCESFKQKIFGEETKEKELYYLVNEISDNQWKVLYYVMRKRNYFLDYFYKYKVLFGTWCGVEEELLKIVTQIDHISNYIKRHIQFIIEGGYTVDNKHYNVYVNTDKTLQYDFDMANIGTDDMYLKEYMYTQKGENIDGIKLCTTKEHVIKVLSEIYTNREYQYNGDFKGYLSQYIEALPKVLMIELRKFEQVFSLYMYLFANKKTDNKILDKVKGNVVYSYNYTSSALMLNSQPNNIHGMIDKVFFDNLFARKISTIDDLEADSLANDILSKESHIIFGIDSSSNVSDEYAIFYKNNRRNYEVFSSIDKNININPAVNNNIKINYKTRIAIIGHSLGIADKDTLLLFLKSKDKNGNVVFPNITIYYYDDNRLASNKMVLINNLRKLLSDDDLSKLYLNKKLNWIKTNA